MTTAPLGWSTRVVALGLFTLLASGCAVSDGGYGYGGVAVAPGYYEPYGADYGGWGVGYDVGPVRGGGYRGDRGDGGRGRGGGGSHAYRSAPAGRSAPSIPSGSRGGGGRGGGGGGGRR